ncbi:MAG: exonuclease domain-containing protein [Bacteroidota bacterium]
MKFFSLDVETANHDASTICQIGIGMFENGVLIDTWESLIDPMSYFHWGNVRVHGISEEMVQDAPTFAAVYPVLRQILSGNVVVHHSAFDFQAFNRAYARFELQPITIHWLDSARIVRHTWPQFSKSGYNLANVANHLGIEFRHHDALEDSVTAGKIVVEACKLTDRGVHEWIEMFKI